MTTIKVSEARDKLGRLVDEAAASHEPILITGKRANAVLISEEDWRHPGDPVSPVHPRHAGGHS